VNKYLTIKIDYTMAFVVNRKIQFKTWIFLYQIIIEVIVKKQPGF